MVTDKMDSIKLKSGRIIWYKKGAWIDADGYIWNIDMRNHTATNTEQKLRLTQLR